MNILMLSHYAGTPQYGMEFRSFYMAKEWARQGHQVFIIGATYSHLRWKQPMPGYEEIDGIRYLWVETRTYEGNGMGRVMSMSDFVLACYRHKKELVGYKPDIVVATSVYTFDNYPARAIAREAGAKYVYEVHDLWPLSPMIIGNYSKYHPFIWLLQRGEDYAYRHTDKVVSMLDKSFPHMSERGLDEKRFCCVPNGYLKEEWDGVDLNNIPAEHKCLFDKLKSEGKTIIGFAGGHTASTAMSVLIETANMMRDDDTLAFVLVGKGSQKQELVDMANKYCLENVHFLPSVDKCQVPGVVAKFDIGYMGGVHSMLHQYGTSFNKMTDYMLSSVPIVMSVDEPNSVVERVGCGIQVEAENPEKVKEAVEKLCALSPEQRRIMGAKGKKYAEENLEYATLAQRFLDYVM